MSDEKTELKKVEVKGSGVMVADGKTTQVEAPKVYIKVKKT